MGQLVTVTVLVITVVCTEDMHAQVLAKTVEFRVTLGIPVVPMPELVGGEVTNEGGGLVVLALVGTVVDRCPVRLSSGPVNVALDDVLLEGGTSAEVMVLVLEVVLMVGHWRCQRLSTRAVPRCTRNVASNNR